VTNRGVRRLLVRAVLITFPIAAFAGIAADPVSAATAPPTRFIGHGTTYWDYMGNDGNGNLVVQFDTTEPGLAPNQADVKYAFDSGTQPFFANSGQIVVTGSWATGWNATTTGPDSQVHIGAFGDGTNIDFEIHGFLVTQAAGFGQGPWEVEGSFTPDNLVG